MMAHVTDAAPSGSATISLLVSDVPGTLDRVFSLVRRQGCGIYSLALVPSDTPDASTLTLTLTGGHPQRLVPQLARVVSVYRVTVLRAPGSGKPTYSHALAGARTPAAPVPTHNED